MIEHKCENIPNAVQIVKKPTGKLWWFYVGYFRTKIFYCPYCNQKLDVK